jgi:hypothetical protein
MPTEKTIYPVLKKVLAVHSNENGQLLSLWLTAIMAMASVFMGTAYDMSNAWVHKQWADTAAEASCNAGAMDMEYAANTGTVTTPNPAMNFLTTSLSSGDCADNSSNAMCYYANLNGYSSKGATASTVSNDVGWTLSTAAPLNAATSVAIVNGQTANGVPAYLNVTVTENVPVTFMGIFAHVFRMSNSWQTVQVVGHCNCGLVGESVSAQDATLANDEWCMSAGSTTTCNTNAVVPGAYLGWSWLAMGYPQNSQDIVANGNADAVVPPSGTQAVISLYCGGQATSSLPCRTPVFSFPDTPVSPTTPITIHMSGTEPALGHISGGTAGGAWVNLSTSTGTITASTLGPVTFCTMDPIDGSPGAAPDPNAYDYMSGEVFLDSCSGWGLYGGQDYGLTNFGTINPPHVFTQIAGPLTDSAVVLGVTNLNQIQVSAGASYGNEYDGFIWAGIGGGGGSKLHVATFSND